MVYGEEDRVFRVEHLSSAATYPRVALAELRPMQCRALADDERVESAFDASTVLPVVCWGASDPKEPAAGSRSCCVFLACSSTVLGFVSQPDTYIKSSSAYDQILKHRFCTVRAFERPNGCEGRASKSKSEEESGSDFWPSRRVLAFAGPRPQGRSRSMPVLTKGMEFL